jgi:hypothetical protein
MDFDKALKSLDLKDLWEYEDYELEIIEDFKEWFENETYVQDFIESNLRSDEGLNE